MIDNIGDKVGGKMRVVEHAVNANKPCCKVVGSERPFGSSHSKGIPPPGDGKGELSLKILLVNCMHDLLQVVGCSQWVDAKDALFRGE